MRQEVQDPFRIKIPKPKSSLTITETIMLQDDPCLDHLSQAMHHDPGQLHEGHCKHVGVETILNVVLKEGLLWGQFIQ